MKHLISGMISLMLLTLIPWSISQSQAAFSDVPSSHPYNPAISYVESEGIVSGYPDGSYQPDRILNRAEFVKIIIESRFDENTINSCLNRGGFYDRAIFSDVAPGVWFEKYVCVARANAIIQGYNDGTFRPIQEIIFAESGKIVTESYSLKVGSGDPWFEPYLTKLAGLNAVPPSLASVSDLVQRGIKPITRGEMADIIYRLRTIKDTVVSDDGNVSLRVPETALPRGLRAQDITVSRLAEAENPVKEVNGAPMLFYKLEPDGVQFEEPVTLTVETQTVANTVPMVFLVSGDSFDIIPDPTIEIDQNLNTAFLTAQINHFSSLGFAFPDYFNVKEVTLNPAGNQKAGNPFTASVEIDRIAAPPSYILQANGDTIEVASDWTLAGLFFETIPESLSPFFKRVSTVSKQSGVTLYNFDATFDCSMTGADSTSIEYEGTISWQYSLNGTPFETESIIRSKSPNFTCEGYDENELLYEQWRQFAFENLNQRRAENGVAPLKMNTLLNDIADVHAEDMAVNIGELSHQGSLGEQSFDRIKTGKVINIATGSYQTLPFPANIDRSGENVGRRNINFFNGNAEQAIIDQHQWFLDTPSEGVTHRTTMLSTNIPFTEVGIGLFVDDNNNLWIVENFISLK